MSQNAGKDNVSRVRKKQEGEQIQKKRISLKSSDKQNNLSAELFYGIKKSGTQWFMVWDTVTTETFVVYSPLHLLL